MNAPVQHHGGGYVERSPGGGSLADVVELILDRGMVIDVFARVSLVGIELLTVDARIVVASVDTYLRFAEATNRLDLESGNRGGQGLPDLVQGATESGAKGKTAGALDAAVDKVREIVGSDDEDEPVPAERPRRRRPRTREGDQ